MCCRWRIWFVLLWVIALAACSQGEKVITVDVLRVAVLPDQSEAKLRQKYQPLLDYLKSHLDMSVELLIPSSYKELMQWFEDKQVELALFGGVTYVKAHLENKALPLVMRDVDGRFRSVVLVRADNPANSLEELRGASLAFGSRLSTIGHFMPRHFFQQFDIKPETYFGKIQYSGSHDLTAEWVRDGKVEVGVSHSGIVNEMFQDGSLTWDSVKVIWESPPVADYVWVVQPYLSKGLRIKIRDSFLRMNQDPANRILLQSLGANYYIPVVTDDFRVLEQVILEMGQ